MTTCSRKNHQWTGEACAGDLQVIPLIRYIPYLLLKNSKQSAQAYSSAALQIHLKIE